MSNIVNNFFIYINAPICVKTLYTHPNIVFTLVIYEKVIGKIGMVIITDTL